jgi:hypothetical protein
MNKNRSGGTRARPGRRGRAGEGAAGQASALLDRLALPGARAIADPAAPGTVFVSRSAGGVSVAAGRFPRAAAEDLVRRDLAAWRGGALAATAAGLAHLRRQAADPAEEAFRAQHGEIGRRAVETPAGPAAVRANLDESPLDWLRRRRGRDGAPLIDEACYEAGERLRRDITQAGLLPGVTARWDLPTSDGPAAPAAATDRIIAARQRVRHAVEAIGAEFGDLLVDLCGFLKGLEQIERERGWPPRSGKVVVRLALDRLAEHYGLDRIARGPAAAGRLRRWAAGEGGESKGGGTR